MALLFALCEKLVEHGAQIWLHQATGRPVLVAGSIMRTGFLNISLSGLLAACVLTGSAFLAAPPAKAEVTYSFVGSGGNTGDTFSFTQPGFVTAGQHVSSFSEATGGFASADFCFAGQFGGNCFFSYPQYSFVGLDYGGSETYIAYDGNPFLADGIYNASSASGSPGVLTVSGATSTISAAPEPSTWALMIVGIAGLGMAMRTAKAKERRRSQALVAA